MSDQEGSGAAADIAHALLERAVWADPSEDWKVVGTLEVLIHWLREQAEDPERAVFAHETLEEIITSLLYLRVEIVHTEDYIEDQATLFREMLDRADAPKDEEE